MAAPDLVNLYGLMDDAKCLAFVRRLRASKARPAQGASDGAAQQRSAPRLRMSQLWMPIDTLERIRYARLHRTRS